MIWCGYHIVIRVLVIMPNALEWGSSMYDDNAQDYTKDIIVSNKRMCSMKALLLLLSI